MTLGCFGAVEAVEMVRAEVLVGDMAEQDEVGGAEDFGCDGDDGDDGLLGTTSGLEAEKLGLEITVLGPGTGPSRLDQCGLQPGSPMTGARALSFAGALMHLWTEPCPGDQVTHRGEAGHVRPNLAQDYLGRGLADSGDGT